MFKKEDEQENKESLPAPLDFGFSHDIDDKPMTVVDAREQFEIGVNIIKAEDLVGEPFIILSAKPFISAYDDQDFAYFCECTDLKHTEVWGTVIGGGQPKQFITDYIAKGAPSPLQAILTERIGGRHGKYYVME